MDRQIDNLRWCERLRDTHTYWHVEGLAKKIRKKKSFSQEPINANAEQREIDVFYKVGWQYQHAHVDSTCDISDVLFVQPTRSFSENLIDYYQKVLDFIRRFKVEHEEDSVCRVQIKPFLSLEQMDQKLPYNLICAKGIYKSSLNAIRGMTKSMNDSMLNRERKGVNSDIAGSYWNVKEILLIIQQWVDKYHSEIEECPHPENQDPNLAPIARDTLEFMSNFAETVATMNSEKRSALFNMQPNMEFLTNLIHPALLGIYTVHQRQKISWEHPKQHDIFKIPFEERVEDNNALPEDPEHSQIPRTVFINLDGYESEYNIEFARNMDKHLMYISFPYFKNNGDKQFMEEEFMTVNNRFFKKVMYNYCQEYYEHGEDDVLRYDDENTERQIDSMEQDDDIADITEELQLQFNPEDYFESVRKAFKKQEKGDENIYILPLKFKYLMQQLQKKDEDAHKSASYFIWFLLKDFVGDNINKFNPHYIVVSYSGRINILDEHFTRIIQGLCSSCSRKVLFFPNFSTELVEEEAALNYQYDNFPPTQSNLSNPPLDLYKKMSQFLKIASGTYNLEIPYDRPPILSVYKTAKVNKYIIDLLDALSTSDYPQLSGRLSDIIMTGHGTIVSREVDRYAGDIENALPVFYKQLFFFMSSVITGIAVDGSITKELNKDLQVLIANISYNLREIARSEGKQNIDYLLAEIMKGFWLQICQEKYSEQAYVYLKVKACKNQWADIKQSINNTSEILVSQDSATSRPEYNQNIDGVFSLTFRYTNPQTKAKTNLKVYPNTQLLYKTDQQHRIVGSGKKWGHIMLMNHLDDSAKQFTCFSGLVNLSDDRRSKGNKINEQRVEMFPITFHQARALPKYSIRSNWNYAETRNYYMLYWPVEYNILEAKLRSIEDLPYEPSILAEIYVAKVLPSNEPSRLQFHLVNLNENQAAVLPRRSCSAYEMVEQDKIFIFGGMYEREYNYLNMQADITGFDLRHYDQDEGRKCIVTNEKGTMYSRVNENAADGVNSYIRTRKQLEFLELTELCNDLTEEQLEQQAEFKTIFILGGYGEQFVRPFSLMSSQYFEMTLHVPSRSIRSIRRRMIYGMPNSPNVPVSQSSIYSKILTANIKGLIKNRGSFREFSLYENGNLKSKAIIDPDHYIAHRTIFKANRNRLPPGEIEDERFQLVHKTKYFFAVKTFEQFQKPFHQLAQQSGEPMGQRDSEPQQFMLSLSREGNHYLTIKKDNNSSYTVQIMLAVERQHPNGNIIQKVSLPHQSIVSIDVRNKTIYAIVQHEYYTKGAYVLAECSLKSEKSEALLRVLHQFKNNMSSYSIFIPKVGEIVMLHGLTFEKVKIYDYFLRHKKDSMEVTKEIPLKPINFLPHNAEGSFCQTYFFKDEMTESRIMEVESLTFILPRGGRGSTLMQCVANRLKLFLELKQNFYWEHQWSVPFAFEDASTQQLISVAKLNQIREGMREYVSALFNSYINPCETQLQNDDPEFKEQRINPSTTIPSHNIILIKITSSDKKTYLGCLNSVSPGQEAWKVQVYREGSAECSELMRSWDNALPIKGHLKSLVRYRDMDITICDAE